MRTRFPLIIISLILFQLLFSCQKDSNGGGGGTSHQTEVVIDLPTNNQIVINGTTLKVEGTVTDNNILASVRVQVRNKATGSVLFSGQATTATVTFYRYLFNLPITGITSPLVATVRVTGRDLNGGEGFKEVDINLEP